MKTPREILWDRNRWADSKLDRIRMDVLETELSNHAALRGKDLKWKAWLTIGLRLAWQELFWRNRRIWGALAAVWLVLIVTNFGSDGSRSNHDSDASLGNVAAALHERARLLGDFARGQFEVTRPKKSKAVPPLPPGPPQSRWELRQQDQIT
jgi:hypothetical protein